MALRDVSPNIGLRVLPIGNKFGSFRRQHGSELDQKGKPMIVGHHAVPTLSLWATPSRQGRRSGFTTLSAIVLVAGLATPMISSATSIFPSQLDLVANVETRGEYDNADLAYWNGKPVSPTNHPTAFDDQLSASWSFYVDPNHTNELYIVVSDVRDTNFGYITGTPFDLVALTGFEFSMKTKLVEGDPSFSDGFAIAGESLLGPLAGSSVPLTTTPGWSLVGAAGPADRRQYQVATASVNDAFTHFSSVFGETRIGGGGVFSFSYAPHIDLLDSSVFESVNLTAFNGNGAYMETGSLTYYAATAPEPAVWVMLLAGFVGVGGGLRWSSRRQLAAQNPRSAAA